MAERNDMLTPSELSRMFQDDELSRDEYWQRMREWHVSLREYSGLISSGSMVAAVEITGHELVVRLNNGARFYWEPEDVRTPPSVALNNGAYEADILVLLERLSSAARTVLDIGANIGWFSVQLGRVLAGRGGELVAFEPLPPTFERLHRNIELNDLRETVTVVNAGLGEERDTACFYLPANSGSVAASRRKLYPSDTHARFECSIQTLDDVVAEMDLKHIDLIKCDVEGAEIFALRGARESLSAHRPVVMLEMLRKWAAVYDYHPNDIIKMMEAADYTCYSVEDGAALRVARVEDTASATNYLFIPSSAPRNPVVAVAEACVGGA